MRFRRTSWITSNGSVSLTHIATQQFENGFVQSKYRVADTA
jgi:hypothetical protein